MSIGRIAVLTEEGLRSTLEDAAGAFELLLHPLYLGHALFAIVCDGVGGNAHGEVASGKGVQHTSSLVAAALAGLTREALVDLDVGAFLQSTLIRALTLTNASVVQAASDEQELKSMSSTVVAILIWDGVLHLASAGDSRCYLYRRGCLRQLSEDHTEVQALIDAGVLTAEQAKSHPLAHTINRYLGQPDGFQPDISSHQLRRNDVIFLCTDGLTDVLSDAQIAEHLEAHRKDTCEFDALPGRLVEHALAAGTTDNVTVLCCHYEPSEEVSQPNLTQTLTGEYLTELADSLQPTG